MTVSPAVDSSLFSALLCWRSPGPGACYSYSTCLLLQRYFVKQVVKVQIREDVIGGDSSLLTSQHLQQAPAVAVAGDNSHVHKSLLSSCNTSATMVAVSTPIHPYMRSLSRHCGSLAQQLAFTEAYVGKTTGQCHTIATSALLHHFDTMRCHVIVLTRRVMSRHCVTRRVAPAVITGSQHRALMPDMLLRTAPYVKLFLTKQRTMSGFIS